MSLIRYLVSVCLLVATFESPIGNSMDSFVLKYEVHYCPGTSGDHIKVIEQVVNGRTEATIGAPRSTFYPVPSRDAMPPVPPANSEGIP